MKRPLGTVLATAISSLAATLALAQPAAPQAVPAAHDCSRWPASAYDERVGICVCPQGLWWNLRGDACLPKEHAAGEFCGTVWPGSQPLFTAGGGYRCVCIPPLIWDSQATGCRAPIVTGEQDCTKEWPGTLPVLSPSGIEFECRCPGGLRWDDGSRNCVQGAPVVSVSRGFFVPENAAPSGGNEAPAAPSAPGATIPTAPAPPSVEEQSPPLPNAQGAPAYGQAAPPSGQGAPPTVPKGSSPACDALLAEIRGRAAAGQADQADALGMKAAIAGCDPKAIADAAHVAHPPGR